MRTCLAAALGALAVAPMALASDPSKCDAGATAQVRGSTPSPTVAARLGRGKAVDLEGTVLDGDLVLKAGSTVSALFRCRGCRIEGRVIADNVDFARTVDLSGATIVGSVRLSGARFEGPLLLEAVAEHPTRFEDETDFTRASFVEGASFTGAVFSGPAAFASARFLDDVTFDDSCFEARTAFKATTFAERADFRRGSFAHLADFTEADFRAVSDFSQAEFWSASKFRGAQFTGRSTFFGAVFRGEANFDNAVAAESLDYTDAHFRASASFFDFESSGVMTLDGRSLESELVVSGDTSVAAVRIVDFDGVVAALDRYGGRDNVEHFLGVIESAAKARDDLKLANNARYERRKRLADRYSRPRWLVDYVFYRGVSGYLVRPWHPLATLVIVAFVFAAARRYHAERMWGRLRGGRLAGRLHPLRTAAAEVFGLGSDTFGRLGLVVKPPGDADAKSQSAGGERRWLLRLEGWLYRVLVVVAALALANSNPTLRQMFDAVF